MQSNTLRNSIITFVTAMTIVEINKCDNSHHSLDDVNDYDCFDDWEGTKDASLEHD